MTISVMITTRNRSADLRKTLNQLTKMDPLPLEVLVCADGCSDDTVDMVREVFPWVHLTVNTVGLGSVGSRHKLMGVVSGDWAMSLDDDSYPLDNDFFDRVMSLCDAHPEAGVITFPELNDCDRYANPEQTPSSRGRYVSAYANCAALTRVVSYSRSPGFPEMFFHMYEEPDYALQCYADGYAVWFDPSLTIRHHMSPVGRRLMRIHQLGARNELWSVWMRCPFPQIIPVSLFRVWRQARYSMTEGLSWTVREPVWWWEAMKGIVDCREHRKPVDWDIYYAWMKLARQPIYTYQELRKAFPRTIGA